MYDLIIKNGRVIDPDTKLDQVTNVYLKNKKIAGFGNSNEAKEVLDAKNKIVTPGLFDMHVHLREPGREDKETIETGLRSAIKGGVTSVLSMPNTTPLADNQSVIEFQNKRAQELQLSNLFVSGRITKNKKAITEMSEMKTKGIKAVTDDGQDVQNEKLLQNVMKWAKTFDLPLLVHAEVENLAGGSMHEGTVSLELGLDGISYATENIALQKSIFLAQETGCKLHITHLSNRYGLELVKNAKKQGLNITCEVCPHHLFFSHEKCYEWNTNAKMYPPLREKEDMEALTEGLINNDIDVIASDHAPHLLSEKMLPFAEAPNGVVGLETLFASLNTFLLRENKISLLSLLEKLTTKPAKILNVNKGTLEKNSEADLAIFNLEKKWTVDENKFETKGKNSIFKGLELFGKAEHVLVGGDFKLKNEVII